LKKKQHPGIVCGREKSAAQEYGDEKREDRRKIVPAGANSPTTTFSTLNSRTFAVKSQFPIQVLSITLTSLHILLLSIDIPSGLLPTSQGRSRILLRERIKSPCLKNRVWRLDTEDDSRLSFMKRYLDIDSRDIFYFPKLMSLLHVRFYFANHCYRRNRV
jgi:hypothetical protein